MHYVTKQYLHQLHIPNIVDSDNTQLCIWEALPSGLGPETDNHDWGCFLWLPQFLEANIVIVPVILLFNAIYHEVLTTLLNKPYVFTHIYL
jgi:hypothetical protein